MNAKKLVMLLAVVAIAVGVYYSGILGGGEKAPDCNCCYEMVANDDGEMERGEAKKDCDCATFVDANASDCVTKSDDPKMDDPKMDDPKMDDPKMDDPKMDDPNMD